MDARRKRLTLLACILGSTVVMIDGSVVNVALPAIRAELGGGLAGQQWASNAYLLTLGALLLLGGSLGDVFGERRVFALGVVGFGLTSVVCALAPTIGVLIAGRALQGVSGALLTPAALAVIVAVFEPDERNRAIGAWTAWSGIGAALGPLIGGQLVDVASWRWIFAINVPLVLTTVVLIMRALPAPDADASARRRPLDLLGALLCTVGLAGVTFGLIQQPLSGWAAVAVLVPLAGGLAVFAAFVAYERVAAAPMLPLNLFTRRNFVVGNIETLAMYAGLSLLFFYLVIYLQQVAGFGALEAGLASLPVTLVMLVAASRFGALADRHGPRALMGGGPLVAAAGLALLLRLDRDVSYFGDVLPAMLVFALGLSMTVAPLTATVLADAEPHNAGAASGVNNAIARTAGLLGIAAVGVVIAASFSASLDDRLGGLTAPAARAAVADAKANPMVEPELDGVPESDAATIRAAVADASVDSFRLGMGAAAALVAGAGLLGVVGIRNRRRPVAAADCPGGQLVGALPDAARRPQKRGDATPAAADA